MAGTPLDQVIGFHFTETGSLVLLWPSSSCAPSLRAVKVETEHSGSDHDLFTSAVPPTVR